MNFKDKVVVITGASRGIGAQTAIQFAKEGAMLVIDYFVSDYEPDAKENATKLVSKIKDIGSDVIMVECDVREKSQIEKLIQKTKKSFGEIDILINNAGYVNDLPIEERTLEEWHRTIDTNLLGTYLCTKLISKHMNDGGSIVNAASTNGIYYNNPESIDYDASKAGIINLTKNFAKELASRKIRVNATALGWADTEMNRQLPEEFLEQEVAKTYLKRFATEEEVAKLTLFLASTDSSYITGTTVIIDGGISL
ncbi:MAG TPA: SDR family NAD(P)-dependent oxidoreductase [Candidatus Dojkabacteria bacterium]|nr:SDR family NAD(P)-dependent oxidoreductase [Candidatus Dojkabacteria bacterium]